MPTVPFDTDTAQETARTIGDEKVSASEMYLDLLAKAPSLINVGVGQPKVDTSLPSTEDEAWLRVPLTFSVNDETMREWNTKFKLIAKERSTVDMKVSESPRPTLNEGCAIPELAPETTADSSWRASFLNKRPLGEAYGIAACFTNYQTSTGLSLDCFGRSFVTGQRNPQDCKAGEKCYDFDAAVQNINLVIEFVSGDKSVVYGNKSRFSEFPSLARTRSIAVPHGGEKAFINYCIGQQKVFFSRMNQRTRYSADFGDVVIFPAKGSKSYAYYNILVPNSVVSNIVEVRARIEKAGGDAGR